MEQSITHFVRFGGLAAILAGAIFAVIQPIHPPDVVESVTTGYWSLIVGLKYAMCFAFLIGVAALYLVQADRAGWIGLAGFVLFSLSWALQSGFVFTEVFVMPPLAVVSPDFVSSMLGLATSTAGPHSIGAMTPTYAFVGICYLLGGVLFGIATVWAKVLPRWPAVLLAVTALVTPAAVLLPHAIQRLVAIPMGIAVIWLGYSLWGGRYRR